jgi:glucoamylase
MRADLDEWIAAQKRRSIIAMEHAISATTLIRRRESFGQVVVPAKGSVLASRSIANWDPEPDYFFHWLRDSAIVMRGVADLMADSIGAERARWRRHFEDFVDFSLRLSELDGAAAADHRATTQREFRKFLRPHAEIAALSGDSLLAEPRFNPDGTIDIFRWSRPQYDGPALRALACLRYLAAGGAPSDGLARLLRLDLSFTLHHAGESCIGPWEEAGQIAQHYYVALVQLGALVHGRAWTGDTAADWDAAERKLRASLDRHWSERQGIYLARLPAAETVLDTLDAAVLLAVWDADLPDGQHSVADPRVQQTQSTIEEYFAREFPINLGRAAPLLGRYRGDRYFGGGAWYPTTLAAAGLYYRRARLAGQDRDAHVARGNAMMDALRGVTPPDGALSEQVDRATGKQTSERRLTWSYAAFIAASRARSQARCA